MKLNRAKLRWTRRRAAAAALGVIWAASLFGVAIPAWRQALSQHREVSSVEQELNELDRWTVAGMWLERSLDPRAEAINPVWERLFPAERQREELFLHLAGVADDNGIASFELRELKFDENAESMPGISGDEPEADLEGYRVRASFEGDYGQIAGFLGGIKHIERALSVHHLEIGPAGDAVRVELELDVYVRKSDRS